MAATSLTSYKFPLFSTIIILNGHWMSGHKPRTVTQFVTTKRIRKWWGKWISYLALLLSAKTQISQSLHHFLNYVLHSYPLSFQTNPLLAYFFSWASFALKWSNIWESYAQGPALFWRYVRQLRDRGISSIYSEDSLTQVWPPGKLIGCCVSFSG